MHQLDGRHGVVEDRVVRWAMADQALLGLGFGFGARTKDRTAIVLHVGSGNAGVVAAGAGSTDGREHQSGVCRRYRHPGVGIEAEDSTIVRPGRHEGRNDRARAQDRFCTRDDREAGCVDGAAAGSGHQQIRNCSRRCGSLRSS